MPRDDHLPRQASGRHAAHPPAPAASHRRDRGNQGSARPIKDFIEDCCEPVGRYADATEAAVLKAKIAEIIGEPYTQRRINEKLEREITKNGLTMNRCGSRRVMTYTFPGDSRPKAITLRAEECALGE
jgi:hypothetical protein